MKKKYEACITFKPQIKMFYLKLSVISQIPNPPPAVVYISFFRCCAFIESWSPLLWPAAAAPPPPSDVPLPVGPVAFPPSFSSAPPALAQPQPVVVSAAPSPGSPSPGGSAGSSPDVALSPGWPPTPLVQQLCYTQHYCIGYNRL